MSGCAKCGSASVRAVMAERSLEVAGHRFTAELPASRCVACGEVEVPAAALERFELAAASMLADACVSSGEAFAFMRRALGLPLEERAELLDERPEDLARWERCDFVYRSALEMVGALVREKLAGRDPHAVDPAAVEKLLLAYHRPRPLAKTVRVQLAGVGT